MATKRASKTSAPFDLVAAVRNLDRVNKAALATTTLETTEGAVLEWLFADLDASTFDDFRGRFPHRLKGIENDTLARLRALLKQIAEAIERNDAVAIGDAANLLEKYASLDSEQRRVRRAVDLIDGASRRARDGEVAEHSLLIFALGALDVRFRKAKRSDVKSILESVHGDARPRGGKPKGGAGNLGARGALAKLMALTGAFDSKNESVAKKKVSNAFAPKLAAKKPAKRH